MKRLASWKGVLQNGVACLAFSPDGSKLSGAGADQYHSVCVLDVKGKIRKGGKGTKGFVLGKSKGCPDPILDMAWQNNEEFATCGVKNYSLWKYTKKAKFKKPRNKIKRGIDNMLLCITYDHYRKRFLVGTKAGCLQVWNGEANNKEIDSLHKVESKKKKKKSSKKKDAKYLGGKPVDAVYYSENL